MQNCAEAGYTRRYRSSIIVLCKMTHSIDDLRDKLFRVDADWIRKDLEFRLENSERTFHVLSAGFLHRVAVFFLCSIWNGYGSRKTRSRWINPITQVVSMPALLVIQPIEHVVLYATTQSKIVQDWRLIKPVDVV